MRSHDPDEMTVTLLESFPPMAQWDDWVEYDAKSWPTKVEKHYTLHPRLSATAESPRSTPDSASRHGFQTADSALETFQVFPTG